MSDHYLLPSEFFTLVLIASLPAWMLATAVQLAMYKRKNLNLRNKLRALIMSLVFSFLAIAVLGTVIWSVMPKWWFNLVASLIQSGSFLSMYFGVIFPPFALAAILFTPVVAYVFLRRHVNA